MEVKIIFYGPFLLPPFRRRPIKSALTFPVAAARGWASFSFRSRSRRQSGRWSGRRVRRPGMPEPYESVQAWVLRLVAAHTAARRAARQRFQGPSTAISVANPRDVHVSNKLCFIGRGEFD